MKTAYIFDVDGTLTPSRQEITPEFRILFEHFCLNEDVYLVSGSDYPKTAEQLGPVLTDELVKLVYNCSGNSIWERGIEIYASSWTLPAAARNHLLDLLYSSKCPTKTGKHLEVRPGAVNFSTVGRNADSDQRAEYVLFDQETGEREMMVESFNKYFGSRLNCIATIGGETGIDITETGKDKQQILHDFEGRDVWFFGDRMEPGGNDHSLTQAILNRNNTGDQCHSVRNWEDTAAIIRSIVS